MIHGNWVAIRKVHAVHLPKDRPYGRVEAIYSVSIDFDSGNPASYSGYSKLWSWSRNKVKKLMDDLGIEISKPETPDEIRLQKGKLKGHPKGHPEGSLEDEKGHPEFVYNKGLYREKDNLEKKKGQRKDTLKDTTIDPIKILDPKAIKKSRKKVKTEPPEIESFISSISEATKNVCREKSIGQNKFRELSESCFDHFLGKGEKKADWQATVRNWIRRNDQFNNNSSAILDNGNKKAQQQIEETRKLLE